MRGTWVGLCLILGVGSLMAQTSSSEREAVRVIEVRIDTSIRAPIAVAPRPSFLVGFGGTEEELFHNVIDALRLSDGTIVVADHASSELRFFDRAGGYLRTAGRRGKGPGEFANISSVVLTAGDSIMVQDWSTSRISVFDPHGRLVRSFALGPAPSRPRASLVGRFPDGTLLGAASDYLRDGGVQPGLFTLTQTLFTFAPQGVPRDELNRLLERQFVFLEGPQGLSRSVRPFGPEGTVRVSGGRYVAGEGTRLRIEERAQSGRLLRILEGDSRRTPISRQDITAEKERISRFYGETAISPWVEEVFETDPEPVYLPAFRRFEVDEVSRLWIEAVPRGGEERSRWFLLDPAWRFLGVVMLPPRFELRHAYQDGVIGILRNADGVEAVAFLPFQR